MIDISRKKTSPHHLTAHDVKETLSNLGHEPHMDWVIILAIGVIICGVLVANGYFAFVRVGNILSQAPAHTSSSVVNVDPAMLRHVLDQFESRDRERQELIKTYRGPADPSQ
jgi:hypothetical protein